MRRKAADFPRHLLLPSAFPAYAPRSFFCHEVKHVSRRDGSRARVGRLHTPHGIVDTPGFVVVGTNGAVKFVDHHAADTAGMQLMFANTLHLATHPGAETIAKAGGLHKLMGRRDRPLITDSGGFQIFSFANRGENALPGRGEQDATPLEDPSDGDDEGGEAEERVAGSEAELKNAHLGAARRRKYTEEALATSVRLSEAGATFRSYRDGSPIFLSPESSVAVQKAIGADIILPLDDLPSAGVDGAALAKSVARTHRWEARSLAAHLADQREQAMYCVVHGSTSRELRAQSVATLSALPFDGYAIGGSFGRDRDEMVEMLRWLMPLIPTDKPNHLLGMGDAESIAAGVSLGIDTFDSSWPTRLGRHGTLLTSEGKVKVGQARYRDDYGPVDPRCDGFVSQNFSRAYLHHLWRANEPVVHGLLTLHNVKHMMDLMAELREKIWRDEI